MLQIIAFTLQRCPEHVHQHTEQARPRSKPVLDPSPSSIQQLDPLSYLQHGGGMDSGAPTIPLEANVSYWLLCNPQAIAGIKDGRGGPGGWWGPAKYRNYTMLRCSGWVSLRRAAEVWGRNLSVSLGPSNFREAWMEACTAQFQLHRVTIWESRQRVECALSIVLPETLHDIVRQADPSHVVCLSQAFQETTGECATCRDNASFVPRWAETSASFCLVSSEMFRNRTKTLATSVAVMAPPYTHRRHGTDPLQLRASEHSTVVTDPNTSPLPWLSQASTLHYMSHNHQAGRRQEDGKAW